MPDCVSFSRQSRERDHASEQKSLAVHGELVTNHPLKVPTVTVSIKRDSDITKER